MLDRSEYVEQAYFFRILLERLPEHMPMQDLLTQIRFELLASTKLPLAVDFLLTELKHTGLMGPAMSRLQHYFAPFQSFLVTEAEYEQGRFDLRIALQILQVEAQYRADSENRQGLFFFQFESLCRNRLRYDPGLLAISRDGAYDELWRTWILEVRHQVGLVDLADLIFLRSEEYLRRRRIEGREAEEPSPAPPLFGENEGRIALANRRKDPLYLFAAMQRHLGYPAVPRPVPPDPAKELVPLLQRRLERLESRIKLLEEENREGIDITKFFADRAPPP